LLMFMQNLSNSIDLPQKDRPPRVCGSFNSRIKISTGSLKVKPQYSNNFNNVTAVNLLKLKNKS